MKNNRFIATICAVVLAFAGLSLVSCEGDTGQTAAEGFGIKSFFPTKVVSGTKIQITGNQLDRVSAVVFTVASANSTDETQEARVTDFEKVGAGLINVTVPAGIEPGAFKLVTEDGAEAMSWPELTVGSPVALTIAPSDEVGIGGKVEATGTDMEFFSKAVFPAEAGGNAVVEVPAVNFLRLSTGVVSFRVPTGVLLGPVQIKLVAVNGVEATLNEVTITAAQLPDVEPKNEISGAWTWSDGNAYGDGGYGFSVTPGWSFLAPSEMPDGEGTQAMIFTTTDYQKISATGEVLQSAPYTIDMEATRPNPDNNGTWAIGELRMPGASVIHGIPRWGGDPYDWYYITQLSEDNIVLARGVSEADWGQWQNCTLWSFKRIPALTISASIDNTFVYQRQDIVIEGADRNWWIDPDFFGYTAEGSAISLTNFVFKPVSGHYRIVKNDEQKYVTAIPLTAAGALPTTQADGSGAVWVIGDGNIGKPSFALKPISWTPANGFPAAQIAPKVHRVTLTVGRHIKPDAINFKFFHAQGWNGEFKSGNLTYTGDLLRINTASSDDGNLFLANGVTLKDGVSYEFTLDLRAGGRSMGVLTVVEKK